MRQIFVPAVLAALGSLALAGSAQAQRDQIRIVGSSTVYPFATKVAESFGRSGGFKTPVVESTGTGGGFKVFCSGVGPSFPDISNASRRIKPSEVEDCASHGAKEIIEVSIGYDGIVIANSKRSPRLRLSASSSSWRWRRTSHPSWAASSPQGAHTGRRSTSRCRPPGSRCSGRRRPPAPAPPSCSVVMEPGCKATYPGWRSSRRTTTASTSRCAARCARMAPGSTPARTTT